ncbi:hypothetical protein EYF80_011804 [Liparis tanakae]|uniref:Uncharacterized protein n=1 Tax=Liparis tanakae TaxID=230148 RepID=A0A4Z2IJ53_9TELE|nr:hypothetical protein EYF80_011804 [Liparis tanakae]
MVVKQAASIRFRVPSISYSDSVRVSVSAGPKHRQGDYKSACSDKNGLIQHFPRMRRSISLHSAPVTTSQNLCVQNRCSSPALAAQKSLRQAAILGELVKTTVAPQVDAATLRRGARRPSGKHRLNLGSAAPRAFVIWRRSNRQVAAAAACSPRSASR